MSEKKVYVERNIKRFLLITVFAFGFITYFFFQLFFATQHQLNNVNQNSSNHTVEFENVNIWNNEIKLKAAINRLNDAKSNQKAYSSYWYQTSTEALESYQDFREIVQKSPSYYPAVFQVISYHIHSGYSFDEIKSNIDYLYPRLRFDQTYVSELVHLWLQYLYLNPNEDVIVRDEVANLMNSPMDYRAITHINQLAMLYLNKQFVTMEFIENSKASYP